MASTARQIVEVIVKQVQSRKVEKKVESRDAKGCERVDGGEVNGIRILTN